MKRLLLAPLVLPVCLLGETIETDLLVDHVRTLKSGQSVNVPKYDFTRFVRLPDTDAVTASANSP